MRRDAAFPPPVIVSLLSLDHERLPAFLPANIGVESDAIMQ
jgi:hypothetical protein